MSFRGLFIGLTTVDIQYFVESFPGANQKVKTNAPELFVGGPATNAAVAFAKLNGDACLASAVGSNSFRPVIENDFLSTGIKHFDLIHQQEENPVLATVVTNTKNGDRTIFTHHPEKITAEYRPELLFTNVKPDIVMLDGFYPEFGIEAAFVAKSREIPVVLDCGSWKSQYEKLLPLAEVVICSGDFYPPGCSTTSEVFTYLKSVTNAQIAISRGEQSILLMNGENSGAVAVEKTKVEDTLGAGDFLHGAFCYYFLKENRNFEIALEKAAFLASRTCTYQGTRKWLNINI